MTHAACRHKHKAITVRHTAFREAITLSLAFCAVDEPVLNNLTFIFIATCTIVLLTPNQLVKRNMKVGTFRCSSLNVAVRLCSGGLCAERGFVIAPHCLAPDDGDSDKCLHCMFPRVSMGILDGTCLSRRHFDQEFSSCSRAETCRFSGFNLLLVDSLSVYQRFPYTHQSRWHLQSLMFPGFRLPAERVISCQMWHSSYAVINVFPVFSVSFIHG